MTIKFDLKFDNEEFSFSETIDTGTTVQYPSGQLLASNIVKGTFDESKPHSSSTESNAPFSSAESTPPSSTESGKGGSGNDEKSIGSGNFDASSSPVTIVGPFIFVLPRRSNEKGVVS